MTLTGKLHYILSGRQRLPVSCGAQVRKDPERGKRTDMFVNWDQLFRAKQSLSLPSGRERLIPRSRQGTVPPPGGGASRLVGFCHCWRHPRPALLRISDLQKRCSCSGSRWIVFINSNNCNSKTPRRGLVCAVSSTPVFWVHFSHLWYFETFMHAFSCHANSPQATVLEE